MDYKINHVCCLQNITTTLCCTKTHRFTSIPSKTWERVKLRGWGLEDAQPQWHQVAKVMIVYLLVYSMSSAAPLTEELLRKKRVKNPRWYKTWCPRVAQHSLRLQIPTKKHSQTNFALALQWVSHTKSLACQDSLRTHGVNGGPLRAAVKTAQLLWLAVELARERRG